MTTSAQGLFRAARPPKKRQAIPMDLPEPEHIEPDKVPLPTRDKLDFSPTPPEPTLALCHAEAARLAEFPLIWEPAAGDGRMARDIQSCGHDVIMSDVVDRGCGAVIRDFYSFTGPLARAIVTNPPYNLTNWRDGKAGWITHALDTLKVQYLALLLSWNWPGAGGLGPTWDRLPPARVYLCRWKIDFTGGGAPPMLNGWFVWDRQAHGPTQLLMLDRIDARQAQLELEAPE